MKKASKATTSVLHLLGAGRRADLDASEGTGAPKIIQGTNTPSTVHTKAFSARLVSCLAPLLILCSLGIFTPSAFATGEHVFSTSFGEPCTVEPCAAGKLKEPSGVAVNESTGDVYVVDKGNNRVEYFSSAGKFEGEFSGPKATGQGTLSAATGSGDLSAAKGTGDLSAASGLGTVTEGSKSVTGVMAAAGTFVAGQQIEGEFIQPGTTIVKVGPAPETLELSLPAEGGSGIVGLQAGSKVVTAVTTSSPAFAVGQQISGPGIPGGATIAKVGPGATLELSAPATEAVTGAELGAGSEILTGVHVTSAAGSFEVGQSISGPGIPEGTTIVEVPAAGELKLSAPVEAGKGGSGVVLHAGSKLITGVMGNTGVTTVTGRFQAGEEIEATGLPKGTTISGINGEGDLEVSQPATEAGEPLLTAQQSFSAPEGIAVDNSCFLRGLTEPECHEEDPSNGDVYVVDTRGHAQVGQVIDKFSSTGEYKGQLTEAEGRHFQVLEGVAVDPRGRVWVDVYEYHPNLEDEIYDFSNEEANEFTESRESQAADQPEPGIAVSAEHDLYVVSGSGSGPEKITKLNSGGGVLIGELGDGEIVGGEAVFCGQHGASALAVESSSNDVYIDSGSHLSRCGASGGSPIEQFGSEQLREGSGVAVDAASGEVYAADAKADLVDLWIPREEAGISEEQVTHVEAAAATLQAKINPNGYATTYHFEYDTTPYTSSAPHGTSITKEGVNTEVSIDSGIEPVPVSVQLQNLQPGKTYYYRVVAQSEVGGVAKTVDGPGKTFTTSALPSAGGGAPETCPNAQLRSEQPFGLELPDCRAYEMVSPLDKNDNDVVAGVARAAVSNAAPAITYDSQGSFSEPRGAALENRYLSRRGADGWVTQNITPRYSSYGDEQRPAFEELLFTPELSRGLVQEKYVPLVEDEPAGYVNLYVADLASGSVSYQTVSNVTPPGMAPYATQLGHNTPEAADVSTDLSHVVFQEGANLTPDAEGTREHVYEWVGGKLSLVDVPPAGMTFESEDGVGAPGLEAGTADTWHAVSANGSRVFFTAGELIIVGGRSVASRLGQLYLRENPTTATAAGEECSSPEAACTIEVSKSQKTNGTGPSGTDPNGYGELNERNEFIIKAGVIPRPARYWDASADGSRVFFTSRVELTNEAYTGPEDNAANLYEYNVETKELTDLTGEKTDKTGDGAAVLGVVNASEDGSYVYFVAEGALAEGATSGQPNLYLYHAGRTSFIATLSPATVAERADAAEERGDSSDWAGDREDYDFSGLTGPGDHTARVTPDGTALAFESELSLTGYDNERAQADECESHWYQTAQEKPGEVPGETGKCRQVYLYDAAADGGAGSLICASCDPSGARPVGPAHLGGQEGAFSGVAQSFYLPRNLSESGGRLFFQTPDPLVPHDSDSKLDVYEWEAAGEGGCGQAGGCTLPISDVAGDFDSKFMDASPNGENVFIATADQLVPSDTDNHVDAYDVRVGGGFPVTTSAPACTTAEACRIAPAPAPALYGPPPSATFTGPGNLTPSPAVVIKPKPKVTKCKKPKKLSHGKCVKPKKRHKAKKSSKSKRGGKS